MRMSFFRIFKPVFIVLTALAVSLIAAVAAVGDAVAEEGAVHQLAVLQAQVPLTWADTER